MTHQQDGAVLQFGFFAESLQSGLNLLEQLFGDVLLVQLPHRGAVAAQVHGHHRGTAAVIILGQGFQGVLVFPHVPHDKHAVGKRSLVVYPLGTHLTANGNGGFGSPAEQWEIQSKQSNDHAQQQDDAHPLKESYSPQI